MRIVATIMGLLWIVPVCHGSTWTSKDGQLSFDLPNDGTLLAMPSPPATALGMWATADGKTKLVVVAAPAPAGGRLELSGLEEGTVAQVPGGMLVSSSESSIGGAPLYTIAATNTRHTVFLQQDLILIGPTAYKLMAAGPVAAQAQFTSVFQSVRPAATAVASRAMPSPLATLRSMSEHELSVAMGEAAFGILAAAGVIAMIVRNRKKPIGAMPMVPPLPSSLPPPPPRRP